MEPLAVGIALGVVGFVFAWPLVASVGALPLIILSVRIAYNHRGAGRYALPMVDLLRRQRAVWWRRQMTGAALFFLAVWLVVGSLRHYLT
jgi:hypothetical protein